MEVGESRGALSGLLTSICALLALVLAAPAVGLERPVPPTAAAFERSTRELLDRPAFRASARELLGRAGGGTAVGTEPIDSDLFPSHRVLALYGAPQLRSTVLGELTPAGAARLVIRQLAPYQDLGDRPVIPSFDLIGVVANSTPGPDRLYRTRQPDVLIAQYLKRARALGGRLVIDLQPGRSPILDEIDALSKWIAEPDVDIAIDPEWNVGPSGVPGTTPGSITARDLNAVSRRMQAIVDQNDLPPKAMIVHQFSNRSIRRRARVQQRPGVQVLLNFDGIGATAPKVAGYESLATEGLYNGFSLFYDLDTPLIKPGAVLRLEPVVDFLLYQ